ncbi:MAG: hypothetical protein K6C94_03235 [Candidatus Gastranaerophilales bacterium]|nr:hypothetical protein [Candidatus Gastranaerophilales bacterium]
MVGKSYKLIIISVAALLFLYFVVQIAVCRNHLKDNYKYFNSCSNSEDVSFDKKDSCYCKMYEIMLPDLVIYNAYNNGKPLKILRYTTEPFTASDLALQNSDVLIGYGVYKDSEFERVYADIYNIPAYAFDCGVQNIYTGSSLVHFQSECIGTDKFIFKTQNSSGNIHTFQNKLKQLNLQDKKIYLKMDISGAEEGVLEDILRFKDNLTGITLVIHNENAHETAKRIKILQQINKDFVLIARNHAYMDDYENCRCRYTNNNVSKGIYLLFVNKNLVDFKYISPNQNVGKADKIINDDNHIHILNYYLNWRIVVLRQLRDIKKKILHNKNNEQLQSE